jgi:hypothetical protein
VYLAGGGACWGATTCRDVPRSFSESEFTGIVTNPLLVSGTIFDRSLPGNPFATWTFVFVPYCTGDVHAGLGVKDHGADRWEHHGWENLQAAVGAFTTALGRPRDLVVAGSSAGGFGAFAAYDLVRTVWDPLGGTTSALIDDSGPTFVGTATPPALLEAWWDAWSLGSTLGQRCAPACAPASRGGRGDLSAIWGVLNGLYPNDRLALISTTQDATMRSFFADPSAGTAMPPLVFEANLAALARELEQIPNVASYRVGGDGYMGHALLARLSLGPTFLQSPQGPALLDWVSQLASTDPTWLSSTSP